jgi:starch synthase
MKVLHVAAECFPYVKTGGLADVVGALPSALAQHGDSVRLLLPGYSAVLFALEQTQIVCELGALFGAGRVTLKRGRFPGQTMPVYVLDAPLFFRREGNPYQDENGQEWSDNAQRFALLSWVAAHIGFGELDTQWAPEIIHAHDWHAGLTCAYVAAHPVATVKTVFTIHNLAYQGLFDRQSFQLLGLAHTFASVEAMEYYGQISFMKAGLIFADEVTTVSPTYAQEITTAEFGCGLDGVIRSRSKPVIGILNGVDTAIWNPESDPLLAANYGFNKRPPKSLAKGKGQCKQALQRELGLEVNPRAMLFGIVSRLTEQKGLDLVLAVLPDLVSSGAQLALQGTGAAHLESAFLSFAKQYPNQVAVRIGYDESFAHKMMAGMDSIIVPSRFEPCGLTQLYGLRYGSIPVVRKVGGLADTVIDVQYEGSGTGFVFESDNAESLLNALRAAQAQYAQEPEWAAMQERAMQQQFSWQVSATHYEKLYRQLV